MWRIAVSHLPRTRRCVRFVHNEGGPLESIRKVTNLLVNHIREKDLSNLRLKVADTKTSFVNRENEIRELANHNIRIIFRRLSSYPKPIADWRGFSFVYSAQMFGSGKTRLGEEFVLELG